MMKSILLIGAGQFGKNIAMEMNSMGHQILAVDRDEKKINEILPFVTDAQIGDSTDHAFLASLGVRNFDLCLVTIRGDFLSALETVSSLKELGAGFVVARADRDAHEKFLLRNGADEVIYPEKEIARWSAIRYSSEHILDYYELEDGHVVLEVAIPEDWLGQTVGKLNIRQKYGINILAVKENDKLNLSISPETVFLEGQSLLVLGEYKALRRCFQL